MEVIMKSEPRHHSDQQPQGEKHWWLSFRGLIAFVLIIAIGYYLITEHRAHLFNILPLLILLACPLMHVFMHGKHGSDHNHHSERDNNDSSKK